MPYTITTTLTTGETHAYQLDTLDQVDGFVSRIQYRDSSQLVAISDSPITFTYAIHVKSFAIDGVTKDDIAAHELAKREQYQQAYQEQLAAKCAAEQTGTYPAGALVGGGVNQCGTAMNAETALARLVR